jgi:hypothetical protein
VSKIESPALVPAAIRVPSGDQVGAELADEVSVVTQRTSEPAAVAEKTASWSQRGQSHTTRVKAIRRPSGDQSGAESSAASPDLRSRSRCARP